MGTTYFHRKNLLSSATERSEGEDENEVLIALPSPAPNIGSETKVKKRTKFSSPWRISPRTKRADYTHCKRATYFHRKNLLSSALGDFTSVFGMGTGGALPVWLPCSIYNFYCSFWCGIRNGIRWNKLSTTATQTPFMIINC